MSDDAAQYSCLAMQVANRHPLLQFYPICVICYMQVDMKIMYYELIKMLMEHDKQQQSEEEYNVTR